MAALRDASADVVVLDAFVDGRVPSGLTAVEWLGEVRRVLADGGFLLANIGDGPGLRYAAVSSRACWRSWGRRQSSGSMRCSRAAGSAMPW